jgi:hypothetical protein
VKAILAGSFDARTPGPVGEDEKKQCRPGIFGDDGE